VLIVGMFMSVLDTSIVNVAMPVVQTDLGITASSGQWVSTAYSLTEGVMVPISAWLGYRFGAKRTYVLCMIGFTAASALCGLAGGLGSLVAFRILQGVPGGIIPVTCLVMLQTLVPRERLGAAMGLYGLGIVVAPALGPALGGLLTEYVDWRFIFFVNVPIGVLGAIAAVIVLREIPGRRDRPLDLLGFLTIAGGLFALLLALEEGSHWGWSSYPILILLAVASNLILLFVVIERQVEHPLIDLRIFASRQFVMSLVLVSTFSVGLFAVAFYIPQFLQGPARGLGPVDTGLVLVPQALALALLMPVAGLLYDRVGARWLAVAGLALTGTGMMMLSRITVDMPVADLVTAMVVLASGLGLGMMPIMTGGLASVRPELAGSAGSFNTLTQRVSQALGLGLLTAMLGSDRAQFMADRSALLGMSSDPQIAALQHGGPAGLLPLWQHTLAAAQTQAYGNAFFLTGTICLGGIVVALFLPSGTPKAGARPAAH
jgi:EmrB/QacA subfamily drug resistance transporter